MTVDWSNIEVQIFAKPPAGMGWALFVETPAGLYPAIDLRGGFLDLAAAVAVAEILKEDGCEYRIVFETERAVIDCGMPLFATPEALKFFPVRKLESPST